MNKSNVTWFSIISLVITTIININKDDIDNKVIYPIIAVLVISLIASIIYNKIKANKNLTNTAVISKSKKYTSFLRKLVKSNQIRLKKDINTSDISRITKLNRRLIRYMRDDKNKDRYQAIINKTLEERKFLLDKYYDNSDSYVSSKSLIGNKGIHKIIKMSSIQKNREVYNEIYSTVDDMKRILLQLEQHRFRIQFGKYVTKISSNIDHVINAYIDYIGWTNVLLGDNKRGFDAINQAIELLDYKLESLKEKNDDYYRYILLKARALRHIGTTYYTYKSSKDTFVKEKLIEARALITKEDVINYYKNSPKFNDYEKMIAGIDYNLVLYDFYVAIDHNDTNEKTINSLKDRIIVLENTARDSKDMHRLAKVLTLKNQLERKLIDQGYYKDKSTAALGKIYVDDIKQIEKILNNNIYFDEAMEAYVCQKIQLLYANIAQIVA